MKLCVGEGGNYSFCLWELKEEWMFLFKIGYVNYLIGYLGNLGFVYNCNFFFLFV